MSVARILRDARKCVLLRMRIVVGETLAVPDEKGVAGRTTT
jgi:hypothetical protein